MKQKYLILLSLSGLILSCDQLSKHIIHHTLAPQSSITLIPSIFSLSHLRNTGFAFGLMTNTPDPFREIVFVAVPVFALILIVLIFIKIQDNQVLTSIALTTILGGAIGNLIDRLQYGYVIDFLDIHFGNTRLPAFNIADCSIILGVFIVFINTLLRGKVRDV